MCVGWIGAYQGSAQAAPGNREDLGFLSRFCWGHQKTLGAHLQGYVLSILWNLGRPRAGIEDDRAYLYPGIFAMPFSHRCAPRWIEHGA